jgi:thiol-disulfide isomerase/thioredoxin
MTLILATAVSANAMDRQPAPSFTLHDDKGEEVSLPRDHSGVDVYFFWASWCPYCKALMPHLRSILDEYGESVTVFALNIRDDENPREFLDKYGYDFILFPEADSVMEAYGVKGTPGLFLVDGCGQIRFNLYVLEREDDTAYQQLDNAEKAARRAPWWAAEIRQSIDTLLSAGSC